MSIYKPTPFCNTPLVKRDFWITMAVQYIRTRAKRNVARTPDFTTEDLAIEMKVLDYPSPPDTRLMGLAIQRARRENLIRLTDRKRLTRARHLAPVWERVC